MPPPPSMNTARSVRQPVSCEPCRRRKIKCSRTRPPCETCRRRGCADDCSYKVDSRYEPSQATVMTSNDELLERISNLENLLRKQASAQIPDVVAGNVTPILSPMETRHTFQPSPSSLTSVSSSHLTCSSNSPHSREVGVLTSSINGDVRYEPQSSQWTSVLANTNLSIATPSFEDQEDSGTLFGFPFHASPVSSMEELLSILPPTQQCDKLKDRYFTVFSPVCTTQARQSQLARLTMPSSFISYTTQHFKRNTHSLLSNLHQCLYRG